MNTLVLILLIVATALLVFVIRIAADVSVIRKELLPDMRSALLRGSSYVGFGPGGCVQTMVHGGDPTHYSNGLVCFVIWEWRDGGWIVLDSPAGIDSGLPPNYPGSFEGDKAKSRVAENR